MTDEPDDGGGQSRSNETQLECRVDLADGGRLDLWRRRADVEVLLESELKHQENLFDNMCYQGTLTQREGSVRLTSKLR